MTVFSPTRRDSCVPSRRRFFRCGPQNSCCVSLRAMALNSPSQDCGPDFVARVSRTERGRRKGRSLEIGGRRTPRVACRSPWERPRRERAVEREVRGARSRGSRGGHEVRWEAGPPAPAKPSRPAVPVGGPAATSREVRQSHPAKLLLDFRPPRPARVHRGPSYPLRCYVWGPLVMPQWRTNEPRVA